MSKKGWFSELAQRLALGCCIKALTGDLDVGGRAAFSLVFVALGLRISRLLRFCDLAISGCSSLVLPGGKGRARFWPARAGRFLDNVLTKVWPVRISEFVGPELSLAKDACASGQTPGREEGDALCSTQISCIRFEHLQIDSSVHFELCRRYSAIASSRLVYVYCPTR